MDIELNGVTYSYMMRGQGPALVLLHGFTGCKENWGFLLEKLAHQFTVITVDLIGHGQTESPESPERYIVEHACRDLNSLLTLLEINAAYFLGYSMGGRVALAFAVLYPSRVRSLILESSSPGLLSERSRQERVAADELLAVEILHDGVGAFVDRWERISLFHSQKKLPLEVQEGIRTQRLRNSPIGLANSLRGMGTGSQLSYWNKLSSIQIPVLLLCGELDSKFCMIAEDMEKCLLHSTKYRVFDAGHAIHVEQPDFFGKIVMEFLHNVINKED
ncbi:2-succinyl-6-hydroxy-2,4-cyclohexadiene-1-carboxylate synthase [Bacillus sp. DJP31]|uniref:2-succinyl-6-hydroxy-2, 4-cyclohexadiene-1-carboxylate synthase n=1 Tax=Bacillus sp. DJP31 TaxID=3409789 RepID=UPI003BB7C07A